MKELTHIVHDPEGLHARTAGILVKMLAPYKCNITLTRPDGKTADAKRLFGVMGLAIKCGQEMVVRMDGEDEETAYADILAFCQEYV